MKKLYLFVIVLLSLFCIISCSIPNEYGNNDIFVTKGNLELKIINKSDHIIYYFIVEQSIAEVINWAPGLNGPSIQSGKHVAVKYSEIYAGENQTVKKGSKVDIYYWDSKADVKGTIIEL
jgi:hypothetical protein